MLLYLSPLPVDVKLLPYIALLELLDLFPDGVDFLAKLDILPFFDYHLVLLLELLHLIVKHMQLFFTILQLHVHGLVLSLLAGHSGASFGFDVVYEIHCIVVDFLEDCLKRVLFLDDVLFVLFFVVDVG